MRRFIPALLVAVIAAMGLAATSSGGSRSFDPHFTVLAKAVEGKETNRGFKTVFKLFNKFDASDKVGNLTGFCTFERGDDKVRCKGDAHLNGEVGGEGDLVVKGNFRRGDDSLLVKNGTGDFNGVVGKMLSRPYPGNRWEKFHFDLVR